MCCALGATTTGLGRRPSIVIFGRNPGGCAPIAEKNFLYRIGFLLGAVKQSSHGFVDAERPSRLTITPELTYTVYESKMRRNPDLP
jgi:hypothetical protein